MRKSRRSIKHCKAQSADRKEMKKREEYENEPLEQHNRKVSLGRSPKVDHLTER